MIIRNIINNGIVSTINYGQQRNNNFFAQHWNSQFLNFGGIFQRGYATRSMYCTYCMSTNMSQSAREQLEQIKKERALRLQKQGRTEFVVPKSPPFSTRMNPSGINGQEYHAPRLHIDNDPRSTAELLRKKSLASLKYTSGLQCDPDGLIDPEEVVTGGSPTTVFSKRSNHESATKVPFHQGYNQPKSFSSSYIPVTPINFKSSPVIGSAYTFDVPYNEDGSPVKRRDLQKALLSQTSTILPFRKSINDRIEKLQEIFDQISKRRAAAFFGSFNSS